MVLYPNQSSMTKFVDNLKTLQIPPYKTKSTFNVLDALRIMGVPGTRRLENGREVFTNCPACSVYLKVLTCCITLKEGGYWSSDKEHEAQNYRHLPSFSDTSNETL